MITAAAAKRSCPWASVTATPIRTPQVRTRVPNYFPAVSCPSLHPLTSLEAVYLTLFQLSLLTDYLHFRHWLETLYPLVEELFQAQHCSSSAIPLFLPTANIEVEVVTQEVGHGAISHPHPVRNTSKIA